MSERGGKRDPKKDVPLGAAPVQKWGEMSGGELVTSLVFGRQWQVQRGDMSTTLSEIFGVKDYMPGKIGKPTPIEDSVVVYKFRGVSNQEEAIKKTDPDNSGRDRYRQPKGRDE